MPVTAELLSAFEMPARTSSCHGELARSRAGPEKGYLIRDWSFAVITITDCLEICKRMSRLLSRMVAGANAAGPSDAADLLDMDSEAEEASPAKKNTHPA